MPIPTPDLAKGERVFVLDVPFAERAVASHHGARWYPGLGWGWVGRRLPGALYPYYPKPYSWQAWQAADLARFGDGDPTPDASTGSLTLRPDQAEDVDIILAARRAGCPEFLLASDVGVGKSPVTVAALKRMPGVANILVVAPLPVLANWRRHLEEMGDGDKRWCLINYDSVKRLLTPPPSAEKAKRTRTKNQHTAHRGVGKVAWDVVVTDESHLCFPAGEQVATEHGPMDIATLVGMDASERPRVYSQKEDGTTRLSAVTMGFVSPMKPLVRVIHEHGEFVCTEDHPVHTKERGYVPAIDLRGLPEGVHPEAGAAGDVLTLLLEPAESGAQDRDEGLRGVPGALQRSPGEGVLEGVPSGAEVPTSGAGVRALRGDVRDRRQHAPDQEVEVPGSPQGAHPRASRVVRVEVLERGGGSGPRGGGRGDQVYNISVEDDENYFVNGVLVHNCANPASQQSAAVERIISGPPGHRPAFVLRLSATAGSNPAQLSYLHRGLAWRTGEPVRASVTAEEYQQWCQDRGITVTPGRFGSGLAWERNADDLVRMNHLLFSGAPKWAIRRRPDWPQQQRFLLPVDLDGDEMDAYEREWSEFRSAMKEIERARARAAASHTAAASRAVSAARAKGLAAQTRYRQKAGLLRARSTAEFVAEMVTKGRQVAVSCEYLGTVQAVVEALGKAKVPVVTFTGENRDTREADRLAFQRGEVPVIVFTPAEGFNLHANDTMVSGSSTPRVTVVAEPRWSPKKALQIEGRTNRNGHEAPCWYAYSTGTVEEKVLKTVIRGMNDTAVINGDNPEPFSRLLSGVLGVEGAVAV